jgi:circadian clock protein KaiB
MPQDREPTDKYPEFERLLSEQDRKQYVLRLYVKGSTTRSVRAISSLEDICQHELQGRYQLEIIDIKEHPELAKGEDIIAAPTLIKMCPLPLRRLIGDLSDKEKVLVGLGLRSHPSPGSENEG